MSNYVDVWKMLLCENRERESSSLGGHRNEFDKDYDRIVYSSSVRRLQDKAQVFPLQENDFTRTRLTHSIEVSALARSFGLAIGKWLMEKKDFKEEDQVRKLSSMLQVAALVHDLGNPPFGHYGEKVIRRWFENFFENPENKTITENLSEDERRDFCYFEGNAQSLRILSRLQILNDSYGVNFTYGTLATIMKYPWSSSHENVSEKKKFGYFQSEKKLAENIFQATSLHEGKRHPVTYLLEAADDIAYLTADIEDGVKKGIVPWEKEYKKIKETLTKQNNDLFGKLFDDIEKGIEVGKKNNIKSVDHHLEIKNFKVFVQSFMFMQAFENFKESYESIMDGKEDRPLLEINDCMLLVKELKRIANEYCFSNSEVIALELVGDKVITGLLDIFVPPIVTAQKNFKKNSYEEKIFSLFSENFKYVCCKGTLSIGDVSIYTRLQLITDYISGMTDSYAVKLYRQLIGVQLP